MLDGKRNGSSPGAGKAGLTAAAKEAKAVQAAEKRIRDRLPELIDHLFAMAPTDRAACVYLIDRVLGKPDVRVKTTHDGSIAIVDRHHQLETLADPRALDLLCELDARLSILPLFRADGGPVGPSGVGG